MAFWTFFWNDGNSSTCIFLFETRSCDIGPNILQEYKYRSIIQGQERNMSKVRRLSFAFEAAAAFSIMSMSSDDMTSRRHSVTCVPRQDHVIGLNQSHNDESGVVVESRVDPVDMDLLAEQREESLVPLKEDLADWLNKLLDVDISADNFMSVLDSGVHVCRLAQLVQQKASQWRKENKSDEIIPSKAPRCRSAKSGSWFARDNVANFLSWCRQYKVRDDVLFETEGLVLHHRPRSVVLCLLEIARLGARYGLDPLPNLITMEREIDQELERSGGENSWFPESEDSVFDDQSSDEAIADLQHDATTDDSANDLLSSDVVSEFSDVVSDDNSEMETDEMTLTSPLMTSSTDLTDGGPATVFVTRSAEPEVLKESQTPNRKQRNQSKNNSKASKTPKNQMIVTRLPNTPLNDAVMKRAKKCKCPDCYDIQRLAEGKYMIGGKTVFIRLLRDRHVMVRVGGGWDTLDHYLEKHDPCRGYRVVDGRTQRISSANVEAYRKNALKVETPRRVHSANPDFLVFTSRYKAS